MITTDFIFNVFKVGFLKFFSAVSLLFLTFYITNNLTSYDAGLFLFSLTVLNFLNVFSRLGTDNILIRSGNSSNATGIFSASLIWVFIFSTLITISYLFFSNFDFFKSFLGEYSTVLSIMIVSLPFLSVASLLSFSFQSISKFSFSVLYKDTLLTLLFNTLVFIYIHINSYVSVSLIAYLYLGSSFLIMLSAVFIWFFNSPHFDLSMIFSFDLLKSSSQLWLASIMNLSVLWSSVIISALFILPEQVAYLSSSQRVASIISFVLIVFNTIAAPKYADFWASYDVSAMHNMSVKITGFMFFVSTPIILIVFFFSEEIMSLFGPDYAEYDYLLKIVSVGQYFNVLSGSVGYILTMSGFNKVYMLATFYAGIFTIISCFILSYFFGVMGAAISTSIGLILLNLFFLFLVKNKLGFWSFINK